MNRAGPPIGNDGLSIGPESPHSQDAETLLRAAVLELIARYGGEDDGDESFNVADVEQPGGVFLVARLHGQAVGCAAVRSHAPGVGEVKRMFVAPAARNKGIGRALLSAIENWAGEQNLTQLILETGTEQPEAIALYEKCEWQSIPNFGIYAADPRSRCYGKLFTR